MQLALGDGLVSRGQCQSLQPVGIPSRANGKQRAFLGLQVGDKFLHGSPFSIRNSTCKVPDRTQLKALALDPFPLTDQSQLRAPSADVDVQIVVRTVHQGHGEVPKNQLRLVIPRNGLNLDVGAFVHLFDDRFDIGCFAHRACRVGVKPLDTLNVHEVPECLHRFHQVPGFVLGDRPVAEHVGTKSHRHAVEAKLVDGLPSIFKLVHTGNQQPDGIGSNVNGTKLHASLPFSSRYKPCCACTSEAPFSGLTHALEPSGSNSRAWVLSDHIRWN